MRTGSFVAVTAFSLLLFCVTGCAHSAEGEYVRYKIAGGRAVCVRADLKASARRLSLGVGATNVGVRVIYPIGAAGNGDIEIVVSPDERRPTDERPSGKYAASEIDGLSLFISDRGDEWFSSLDEGTAIDGGFRAVCRNLPTRSCASSFIRNGLVGAYFFPRDQIGKWRDFRAAIDGFLLTGVRLCK